MIEWQILFESKVNMAILFLVLLSFGYSIVKLNNRQVENSISYRGLFVLLHLLVCVSMLGLLIQPSFQSANPLSANLHILNTQHPPKQLDSNEYVYFSSHQDLAFANLPSSYLARYRDQIVHQPEQVLLKQPGLTNLVLIGDGLLPSQLTLFQNQVLTSKPNSIVTGVANPVWNRKTDAGTQLEFSGTFQSADNSIYQVKLVNPAQQVEDEVSVINGDSFLLKATPKITGTHLFQLTISDQQQNTINKQLVPVEVIESKTAKILMMQSSPSFESKQIQNWAANFGSELMIRTRISKNKFITHSSNLTQAIKSQPERLINLETLALFDLLIVDARELLFFDKRQHQIIIKAVENGLGVLIRTDGSLTSEKTSQSPTILAGFDITPLNQTSRVDLIAHDQVGDQHILADSVLLSAAPLYNINRATKLFSPLIVTPQGHVVVARKHLGLGNVTVSVIKQSYQLRTSDQAKAFSQLWSHIIQNTARSHEAPKLNVKSEHGLLLQNHKINICISKLTHKQENADKKLSSGDKNNKTKQAEVFSFHPENKSNSVKINLQQESIITGKVCGNYWPLQTGWHKIRISALESYFYVHSSQSWLASQQNTTAKATQTHIAAWSPTMSKSYSQKLISDWYYWLLIAVCSSLIWIERKFWSNR